MGDQVADPLLDIARAADSELIAPPGAGRAAAVVPGGPAPFNPGEWVDLAVQLGGMVRAVSKIAEQHWTEDKLRAFGEALGRTAQHYGWTRAGVLAHPLVGLTLASVPLAWPFAEPWVKKLWEREGQEAVGGVTRKEEPKP